ncbi:DUF5993 family protein [Roseibium algae]|uniref:DUF5993 family protein n=1 Tax=Roseibium algae TaxID=3123038 RepID=UPI003BF4ED2F
MYLSLLFLMLMVTLIWAAYGSLRGASVLTAATFVVAVLVYLHHATDTLPLSF